MKLHYLGGVVFEGGDRAPGGPACCIGERARVINKTGRTTYSRALVTCTDCKRLIKRQDAFRKSHPKLFVEMMRKRTSVK